MSLFHLTFSSDGRLPLFPNSDLRLAALHAIARVCGAHVVLFCVVDDHLHVVLMVPAPMARRIGRDLLFALRALTEVPVVPPHVRPVRTRAHAEWLLQYLLGQVEHHGLPTTASRWEGSCLWDLVGLRQLPGLALQASPALPRWDVARVCACVDLPVTAVQPISIDQVGVLGAGRLVNATCRAVGATDLRGRTAVQVRGRAAVGRLARAAGLPTGALVAALGLPDRTVRGFRRLSSSDDLCWAVLGQLSLAAHWEHSAARPLHSSMSA